MALVNSSVVGMPVTFVKDDGLGNSNGVLDHSATSADSNGKPVVYITDDGLGNSGGVFDHSATSQDSNGKPVVYITDLPSTTGVRGTPAHPQAVPITYVLDLDIANSGARAQDHQATSADSNGEPITYIPTPSGADSTDH